MIEDRKEIYGGIDPANEKMKIEVREEGDVQQGFLSILIPTEGALPIAEAESRGRTPGS